MPLTPLLRWSLAAVLAGVAALSQAQSGAAAPGRPASDVAAGPAGLGSDRSGKVDKSWGDKRDRKAGGAHSSEHKRSGSDGSSPGSGGAASGSPGAPSAPGGAGGGSSR